MRRRLGRSLTPLLLVAGLVLGTTPGVAAPVAAAPAEADPRSWPSLAERLQPIIEDAREEGVALGLFVSDLSGTFGDATLYLGKQDSYTTASTIKLSLAVTVMKQVEAGVLSLADPATIEDDEVVGGSGVLKDRPRPIETTVGEMLELMITVSDNTATNKLVDVVGGFDPINALTQAAGIAKEDLHFGRKMFGAIVPPDGDLWSTPHGYRQLLDLYWDAYEGHPADGFIGEDSTRHLVGLMRRQQVKTKLGAVVPGQLLAHKTGENGTVSHDLGFLMLSGRVVSVGVFTQNDGGYTGDAWYAAADPYVQEVAAVVYDHVLRGEGSGAEAPLPTTSTIELARRHVAHGRSGVRLTVRVDAASTPEGKVVIRDGRRRLVAKRLEAGTATYRLPKRLARGTHRLRARYLPSDPAAFAPSTSPVAVLKVR
ncbi:serine hydrolase [Nocardioides sp. SYSU DS0663]|uniref:serine hydrolase n=1 Tax=Nocardioides sp. SYSU DS0663 TaxID=3416445 RepID=UPI003F4B5D9C